MEDRTITFQNAKLAKEKGFDLELTNYFYKTPSRGRPFHRTGALNNWNSFKRDNLIDLYFSRPTHNMICRWLRESKNIDCWAQPYVGYKSNGDPYLPDESYSFFVFKDGVFVCDGVDFLDDSEALETAIEFALKSL